MNIILFDNPQTRINLLPFTYTRPVADIRIGILKISEKWEKLTGNKPSFKTEEYLSVKFPCHLQYDNVFVDGSIVPNEGLISKLRLLNIGESLKINGVLLAFRAADFSENDYSKLLETANEYTESLLEIRNLWDIFSKNGDALKSDFELITKDRKSAAISNTNIIIGNPYLIFAEEGAKAEASVFNTTDGPIYLAADSEVTEGCLVRGPFSLGEHSQLKMGAKIYGPTTFGPHVKVGGEVNNSVIFGYSNKAHDGFLGNSVIGEWCNLGADSNNSNLKNNYAAVKLWNYGKKGFVNTGLQFCGLFMGDHSKCGINTMFNTGTVTGVSANIFGAGFPRNFIPSFAWGGAQGFSEYRLKDAVDTSKIVFSRRKLEFDETEYAIMQHIFEETAEERNFS